MSSFLPNASLTTPASNFYSAMQTCLMSHGQPTLLAYNLIGFMVLLPLCVFVFYLTYHQRRQQHSGTNTMSHIDVFTLNGSIMELLSLGGSTLCLCASYTGNNSLMMPGTYIWSIKMSGIIWFHIVTCLERYLAVVHPIKYLGLRKMSNIRKRNMVVAGGWLFSLLGMILTTFLDGVGNAVISMFILTGSVIIIDFFSCSLFCRLMRPGPQEKFGSKQSVDPIKLRALMTTTAILAVLLIKLAENILVEIMAMQKMEANAFCSLIMSLIWFSLPSDLVLPLLFLHRSWRFLCCKSQTHQVRV